MLISHPDPASKFKAKWKRKKKTNNNQNQYSTLRMLGSDNLRTRWEGVDNDEFPWRVDGEGRRPCSTE